IYNLPSKIYNKSKIYNLLFPCPLSFKQGSIYNLPSAICNPLTVLNYASTATDQDSQAPIKNDSMLLIKNEKRNNC
ncbi:MAG: hypothetical protein AB4060_20800, partial [Crocosphaera sp.]